MTVCAEHYLATHSGHAIAASAYLEWLTGRYELAGLALRTAFRDGHDNNLLQLVAKVLAMGVPSVLYPEMPALSVLHLQEAFA